MKKILVTPSQWINAANSHNTIIDGRAAGNIIQYIRDHQVYKERAMMEDCPNYRQVCPYVIVQNGDDYILMHRTPQSGEDRLKGLHYMGVGGHIEYTDKNVAGCPIETAAAREIYEELGFNKGQLEYIGVILKSETPVDRCHLGMLYHYVTEERQIRTNEMAVNDPKWVNKETLKKHYGNFEGWSKLVFDYFFGEGLA